MPILAGTIPHPLHKKVIKTVYNETGIITLLMTIIEIIGVHFHSTQDKAILR